MTDTVDEDVGASLFSFHSPGPAREMDFPNQRLDGRHRVEAAEILEWHILTRAEARQVPSESFSRPPDTERQKDRSSKKHGPD